MDSASLFELDEFPVTLIMTDAVSEATVVEAALDDNDDDDDDDDKLESNIDDDELCLREAP